MPRILIITFSLLPAIGGAEIYVCKLSEELTSKGYDVTILCREWDGAQGELERVNIVTVKVPANPWGRASFNILGVRRALETLGRRDLVNIHDPFHYIPLGFLHQLAGAKSIVTSHGVTFDNPSDPFTQNFIFYHSAKLAATLADAIIANDRHFLWWCSLWGVPRRKTFYIPNGVDVDRFKPNPVSHEPLNVLVPRNLVEGRGVQVLISAVAHMKGEIRSQAKFYLAGEGPLRNQLENEVDSLGLSESVVFLGRVPHENMTYWYNRSDIVVVPTLWSEGTSLAALEAMSCGLPVIASRVGGLPDIVDNTVGRLVAPGEPTELATALQDLISDTKLCRRLGRNARNRVIGRFTLSHWLAKTMEVFECALQGDTSKI